MKKILLKYTKTNTNDIQKNSITIYKINENK